MRGVLSYRAMFGRPSVAWKLGLAGLAVGAILFAQGLWAEDAGPSARAVRLSSVDGAVHISQGGQVLAETAVANAPLFEGTRVVTGDDGKAEIQFEDGSLARISPNSALTLKVLRGQGATGEAVMVLDGGLGYFELEGSGESGTMRVQFGNSVVTASGATVLRINLDNPPGELAVFSGNAHLERGTAVALDVHGGESVNLSGTMRWRVRPRHGPGRQTPLRTMGIRRGTTWTRAAVGITFRDREMSGRRMRRRTRAGIRMGTGTGCTSRRMGTSGYRVIRGAICPTIAACGTGMTRLAGVGRPEWAAAGRGGVGASMADRILAQGLEAIALQCVRGGRFRRAAEDMLCTQWSQ